MPFDEFTIDPATGQTVKLPSVFSPLLGLPRRAPVQNTPDFVAGTGDTETGRIIPALPGSHITKLSPQEEREFGQWVDKNKVPFDPSAHADYDMRGFWRALKSGDPRAATAVNQSDGQLHFPDTWKTPEHKTFSNESQYATQYAPAWNENDQLIDRHGNMIADESVPAPPAPGSIPLPPPQPTDPSKPELAGVDQQQQGLSMQAAAADMGSQAEAQQAQAEERAIAERNQRAEAVRQKTAQEEEQRRKRFDEINTKYATATDDWAKYKIDPGRRWKNASTGRKIGAAIAVAMSALGDALQHRNGPNLALEMITKAIDDDVGLQVQERQHLGEVANRARTSLDDYRRDTADWREAQQLKLSEEYKRTADDLERIAAGARSEKAKANGLALAGTFRENAGLLQNGVATAAYTREMQQAKFAEDKRQARVAEGQRQQQINQSKTQFDAELKYKYDALDASRKAEIDKLTATGKANEAKLLLERGVAAPPVVTKDADGNVTGIDRNTGSLKQADGTPWIIPTEKEATEFRAKKTAADSLIDILDEMRSIRDKVGGESSWGNSPEYQRLQVLKQNAIILKKGGTQGMSSDADMDRIIESLGAADPASFRSQAAKLEEGRKQTVSQLNTAARNLNYSGPEIEYPDATKFGVKPTAEQATTGSVLLGQGQGYEGGKALQQRQLGELSNKATDPSISAKDRAAALKQLEQGATNGATEDVRRAFQATLTIARVRMANDPSLSAAERASAQGAMKNQIKADEKSSLKFK